MIRTETIIGVNDVEKSSVWYQRLLNCKSKHGGNSFDVLADQDDSVILCLHKWGDHNHPTLTDPKIKPENGLILYFRVTDLNEIWNNAVNLNAIIEEEPHLNKNSGKKEFSLRDLDGYFIIVSL